LTDEECGQKCFDLQSVSDLMKLYAQKTLIRHGLRRATFPQGKALGCAAKLQFIALNWQKLTPAGKFLPGMVYPMTTTWPVSIL
jgi:hypothetical protein